jgi:DNA-binding TFAR19-related protein (PDSD5 family)
MEDDELAAIRAARIQQLKQQAGSPGPAGGRPTPSGDNDDGAQRAAEDEMRRNLLATVLDASARERRTHKVSVAPIYIADAPYVSW